MIRCTVFNKNKSIKIVVTPEKKYQQQKKTFKQMIENSLCINVKSLWRIKLQVCKV